jgi:Alternative complex III, ActD subunit
MNPKIIVAGFATEDDLRRAVRAARERGWTIADAYAPYALHGLPELFGWRRSRLPAACFLCGATGAGLSLWFQFWTTTQNWPLNVGGRPWNSLPAFVPVTFESMVLLGGFGLVFAWLIRCRLYPGKKALLPLSGLTDDRFALVLDISGSATTIAEVRQVFKDCGATEFAELSEETSA